MNIDWLKIILQARDGYEMKDNKALIALAPAVISCCLGNEPTLTPEGTTGRVSLALLISINGKRTCLNRKRKHKLHKLASRKLIFKLVPEVDMFNVACDRVFENFKIENLKAVQRGSLKR